MAKSTKMCLFLVFVLLVLSNYLVKASRDATVEKEKMETMTKGHNVEALKGEKDENKDTVGTNVQKQGTSLMHMLYGGLRDLPDCPPCCPPVCQKFLHKMTHMFSTIIQA